MLSFSPFFYILPCQRFIDTMEIFFKKNSDKNWFIATKTKNYEKKKLALGIFKKEKR